MPRPTDTLHIYPDFSQNAKAVGGHLIIARIINNKPVKLNGGYYSARLSDSQIRLSPCEKETLGIKLNVEHFRPFITESKNTTIIHPDNMISVHAWNRLKRGIISTSSKVAAFLSMLSENNIDIIHCPGLSTKVADYGSRNPPTCTEKRCQICAYITEQCIIGEHCKVNSVSIQDILSGKFRPPLAEKSAWLQIQKDDDTHNRLFNLITSGGLQPEKKLRGHTDLKLLYNMYKKGLLKIDSSGLIVIKHVAPLTGQEFDAISVPRHIYPAIIQSLHVKLCHPSRSQMSKLAQRYFHSVGSTTTVDDIHKACQTCTSLSQIKIPAQSFSTTKVSSFGSSFSADVMVSEGQRIFLCSKKLSQYTYSKFIPDERTDTLREAILDSVIHLIPSTGTVIQVDAAPSFQSIANSFISLQSDDVLSANNISLDIGRIHNPNKNPIAENAVKEFRKEILRLKPRGGPISETERVLITRNMNSRIRNRGFSAKEILLWHELANNTPSDINDRSLFDFQYNLRTKTNSRREREEYIISDIKQEQGFNWTFVHRSESNL